MKFKMLRQTAATHNSAPVCGVPVTAGVITTTFVNARLYPNDILNKIRVQPVFGNRPII